MCTAVTNVCMFFLFPLHDLLNDIDSTNLILNWIFFPNLDLPIIEDDQSPGGSYENLRKIIHAVVQEVIRLPEFYNQKNVGAVAAVVKDNEPSTPFEAKKYEDLLATAVINKVICWRTCRFRNVCRSLEIDPLD